MEWNAEQNSDNSLLRVFYITAGQQNQTVAQTDINASENSVEIGNLGKFVNYTIWMKSVSKRGLGIASYPVYVRTLEEGGLFSTCLFFCLFDCLFVCWSVRSVGWLVGWLVDWLVG